MPHFRKTKEEIRTFLKENIFTPEKLPKALKEKDIEQWISPLFACLPEAEPLASRAASMLGYALSHLFIRDKEKARVIIRRMIWQMNEESGNIGWGIPLAFAQSLAQSKGLASEYHRILISYILERDGDSNYCDYAPLRISCFHAVEILLDTYPDYIPLARTALLQGAFDTDSLCRTKAKELIEKFNIS